MANPPGEVFLPPMKLTANAPTRKPCQKETIVFQPTHFQVLLAFAVSFREDNILLFLPGAL